MLRINRDLLAAWVNVDRQREANRRMQTTGDPDELARCHKIVTDTSRLPCRRSSVSAQPQGSESNPRRRTKNDEPESAWSTLRLVPRSDPQNRPRG